MASIRGVRWALCGWCLLFGVLQVVQASERITVPQPTIQDLLNRANPVLIENTLGYVQAHDSAFQYQQRSYSAPIQQAAKIPTPAIKDAVKGALKDGIKGGLKANAAGVAVNVAVAAAVAAAGWVIDEAGQPVKKTDGADDGSAATRGCKSGNFCYFWAGSRTATESSTAAAACAVAIPITGLDSSWSYAGVTAQDSKHYLCNAKDPSGTVTGAAIIDVAGTTCTTGSYSDTKVGCVESGTAPLTDADFSTFDNVINAQSADFRARLLKESCEGSLSPGRCYAALQSAASFLNSGPASIQGPKTTSQSTSKASDGTTTIATTTRDTKFGMQYDGTGATATPETTTTTKDNKGNESTTVDKEEEDSSTGTAPKEDEKDAAVPCAANCDGPAYKDLYTKTEVTKEAVIDGYAAKVQSLPIVSSVRSFFTVSGGGACPVWSGTFPIDVGFYSKSFTLTFDFACQPWFTALSPAFHALFMLLGVWAAFRVSILD